MALICLVLINVGFVIYSVLFDLARPLVNIDYILALLLVAMGWRFIGSLLGGMFLLADALVLISQVFPFPRVNDLIYLFSFLPLASLLHFLLILISVVALVGKLIAFIWIGRGASLKSTLLLLNVLLVAQVYFVYFYDEETAITYRKAEATLIASQSATFMSMRSHRFLEHFSGEAPLLEERTAGASGIWFENSLEVAPRLLLIVVESWGLPHDSEIHQALLNPLEQLPNESWQQGELTATGITLDGELRELCKLRSNRYNLSSIESGFESCLPNKLSETGYVTAAVHGATGMMYDRHQWYPRVGFQQQTFFESHAWPRRCFSFPGACDEDVADKVVAFFSEDGRRFLYWLTLNSHSPYDKRDIIDPSIFDCLIFDIDPTTESCRNIQLHAQYFSMLADALSDASMQDVQVVIVGDHPPVIMNAVERDRYFQQRKVPWVVLKTGRKDRADSDELIYE